MVVVWEDVFSARERRQSIYDIMTPKFNVTRFMHYGINLGPTHFSCTSTSTLSTHALFHYSTVLDYYCIH